MLIFSNKENWHKKCQQNTSEEATRAGMPFVDHRWLGGMLTNYKTVKQSIKRLEEKTAALENAQNCVGILQLRQITFSITS